MGPEMTVAVAVAGAIGSLTLFAIFRAVMTNPSAPGWVANDLVAYVFAMLFTCMFAASLFYVAFAISKIAPAYIAFFATFAIHGGILATMNMFAAGRSAGKSSGYGYAHAAS